MSARRCLVCRKVETTNEVSINFYKKPVCTGCARQIALQVMKQWAKHDLECRLLKPRERASG